MSTATPFAADPASDPDTVESRLRAAGQRMTVQRRVVAQVFDDRQRKGRNVHLTAERVLGLARVALPEISLATVYNTLNNMVELGVISDATVDDGPKRFDANVTHDHHHLVCVVCAAVADVDLPAPPVIPRDQHVGFEVSEVDVVFRGRCPDCRG